jgi:hypothetical protein
MFMLRARLPGSPSLMICRSSPNNQGDQKIVHKSAMGYSRPG